MAHNELKARASIRIHGKPSDVFAAFADAGEMSKFWFTRRDAVLTEGQDSTWHLGTNPDAYAFDVHVRKVRAPHEIVIEWPGENGELTQVRWTFAASDDGGTVLTVEESGFTGSDEEIVARVIDSTCGFNQVIVAAKALIEHGAVMNVVADHA